MRRPARFTIWVLDLRHVFGELEQDAKICESRDASSTVRLSSHVYENQTITVPLKCEVMNHTRSWRESLTLRKPEAR